MQVEGSEREGVAFSGLGELEEIRLVEWNKVKSTERMRENRGDNSGQVSAGKKGDETLDEVLWWSKESKPYCEFNTAVTNIYRLFLFALA